jgi:hypothetical protein
VAFDISPVGVGDNPFAFYMLVIFGSLALFVRATILKGQKKIRDELLEKEEQLRAELLEKEEQLKAEYSKEYEQRKLTIGTIKCSQCEWSGQWGTGMTYEQFFAGNLANFGIEVNLQNVNNDNLSSDNRQYTCPVCNSSGWKKARDIQGVNYWIKRADQVGGPKSRQEVVKLAKASKIKLNDEISNSKDGPWKSLTKEDLQQMLAGSDIEIE